MAFHHKIENGILHVTFEGYVTVEDLFHFAELSIKIEAESKVSLNRLIDFSNITGGNWNFEAMESFAAKRRSASLKNRVRSAIVAPKPLQYGYARMYQQLHDHPDINLQVFTNEIQAVEWLTTGNSIEVIR